MADRRTQKSIASTVSLTELLRMVTRSPQDAYKFPGLKAALKSQGKLAAYECLEQCISKSSINTLKRSCESFLSGGFTQFDKLRLECLAAVEEAELQSKPPRPDTKKALVDRSLKLGAENAQLLEDLTFVTELLGRVMMQARNYAGEAGHPTIERCAREQREVMASLGLRPSVGDLNGPRGR